MLVASACSSPRRRRCSRRSAPIGPRRDEPSNARERLLDRRVRVGLVSEVEVDALARAGRGCRRAGAGFARAPGRGRRRRSSALNFVVSGPAHAARGASARSALAAPAAVRVGGVEGGMPSSHAASMSANAPFSALPWPKNSGAEPTPPKLPQPSTIRGTSSPVSPSGRRSTARAYGSYAGRVKPRRRRLHPADPRRRGRERLRALPAHRRAARAAEDPRRSRLHRDELLFQTVHQASELWLKLAWSEVDEATSTDRSGRACRRPAAAAARHCALDYVIANS